MRWYPKTEGFQTELEAEKDRLISDGCTEYQARQVLAAERIATQLEVWASREADVPRDASARSQLLRDAATLEATFPRVNNDDREVHRVLRGLLALNAPAPRFGFPVSGMTIMDALQYAEYLQGLLRQP